MDMQEPQDMQMSPPPPPFTPSSPPQPSLEAAPQGSGPIKVERSVLKRAVANDKEALSLMFHQFIPADEEILFAEFLGVEGMWGFGKRSFACLTNRRIAALKIGAFKEVIYQDGYLEGTNSGIIYQPSKLWMYILLIGATCFALWLSVGAYIFMNALLKGASAAPAIVAILLSALLLVLFWQIAVRLFYRFNKCGLVWWIREGVAVYVFSNRGRLVRANYLYRLCTQARDDRIKKVREPI